jgi:hypothetical protein
MKSKVRILIWCGLLMCSCIFSDAQDYYGGGNGSWRRQPSNRNNNQQKQKSDSDNEASGYISINFGFATPEGNFGQSFSQSGYNNQAAGIGYGNYADPGTSFHFSLGIPINHSNFGIAFMFGSYTNQYDINNYVNSLVNSPVSYNAYANSPIEEYASGNGQNVYTESSILGGGFATYPIGRLSIDGRLMIGALLCNLPEQNVYAEDAAGDELDYDVEPSNSTAFAFDLGVGVRFMVAQLGRRKLCIMANVDYMYSKVSYNTQQDLYVVPASGNNAGYQAQLVPSPQVSGNLPIQLLNVTFGIGYQL